MSMVQIAEPKLVSSRTHKLVRSKIIDEFVTVEFSSWNALPLDKPNSYRLCSGTYGAIPLSTHSLIWTKLKYPLSAIASKLSAPSISLAFFAIELSLAIVSWRIRHVIIHYQMILIVDGNLAVVAMLDPAAILHQPTIRVNEGHLVLLELFELA